MCQTTVYLIEDGKEIPLLQDVVNIIPDGGRVRIVNLFGEEKVVEGRIKQIDLLTHKIIIGAGVAV
jgi:predicted RNA-binding protein